MVSGADQLLRGKGCASLDFLQGGGLSAGCVGSPRGEGMIAHELLGTHEIEIIKITNNHFAAESVGTF